MPPGSFIRRVSKHFAALLTIVSLPALAILLDQTQSETPIGLHFGGGFFPVA
jgi:hypothetical protein